MTNSDTPLFCPFAGFMTRAFFSPFCGGLLAPGAAFGDGIMPPGGRGGAGVIPGGPGLSAVDGRQRRRKFGAFPQIIP